MQTVTTSTSDPAVLTYYLKTSQPIELLDLAASLAAIGEQFRRFMREHGTDIAEEDVRLYIKEVREGSVVADLIALAQQLSLVSPDTAWVVQFADQLQSYYEFFKGSKTEPPKTDLEKSEYDRLAQIIDPVAKDNGAQMNITASSGAVVNVSFNMSSIEANAVQNRIRRYRDRLPETLTGIHQDQVFFWYQVRDDTASKPGDRGVIPRLDARPVKVQFASDAVKTEMIDRPENPFRLYYVVEVDVTEIGGRPVLYRILEVKGTMDRE